MDAAGCERVPLLGVSQGCSIAIDYAVRHPERVSHLVLYGGFALGWRKHGDALRTADTALATMMRTGWGHATPAFRQIWTSLFIPAGATRGGGLVQRDQVAPDRGAELVLEVGDPVGDLHQARPLADLGVGDARAVDRAAVSDHLSRGLGREVGGRGHRRVRRGAAIERAIEQRQLRALGIVETTTVAAAILAADAGVKGAQVRLVELRLADGSMGRRARWSSGCCVSFSNAAFSSTALPGCGAPSAAGAFSWPSPAAAAASAPRARRRSSSSGANGCAKSCSLPTPCPKSSSRGCSPGDPRLLRTRGRVDRSRGQAAPRGHRRLPCPKPPLPQEARLPRRTPGRPLPLPHEPVPGAQEAPTCPAPAARERKSLL